VFTLLRKDLITGEYIDALAQLEELKGIAETAMQSGESYDQAVCRQVVEFSEAFLYTSIEKLEKVPETYLARNAENGHLLQGMGLYNLMRARSAYLMGNVSIAAAECDLVLELRKKKVQHSQLIRLSALILKSKAERRLLNNEQALIILSMALKEAAQDEIYLPFVEDAGRVVTTFGRDKDRKRFAICLLA